MRMTVLSKFISFLSILIFSFFLSKSALALPDGIEEQERERRNPQSSVIFPSDEDPNDNQEENSRVNRVTVVEFCIELEWGENLYRFLIMFS